MMPLQTKNTTGGKKLPALKNEKGQKGRES